MESSQYWIRVSKVDNGYVLTVPWYDDYDSLQLKKVVFEELDCEGGEVLAIASMLRYLVEYFGMVGSKHDKHRISIETAGAVYPLDN